MNTGEVISPYSPENSLKDDLRHSSPKFLAASLLMTFSLADLLPSPSKTLLVSSHFLKTLLCLFFFPLPWPAPHLPSLPWADPFKCLQAALS